MNEHHYKAFISYNHNPRDSRITRHLQSKLENFRIPKELRKGKDSKGVGRVFLDKGELEVAGDLDEKILWALEHSEFLIVICSPESKESPWVHKEIEYFLQFHEKDNVLTVVTEGEPKDVLPEILLQREVVADTGERFVIPQEPLACDYRGPIRKAEKEELPRLVAALIHCRYDDLMQRQRSYRMKRMIAVLTSAAAAFALLAGYMIWSNVQINENYLASLKEQSHSLALQSEEALQKGDRIKAIEYALEALPTEEQERPVVSDAVYALSEAIDLYNTPEEETISAVRTYGTYERIRAVKVSNDEPILAMIVKDGALSIRNTETGAHIGKEYIKKKLKGKELITAVFADHGRLVLFYPDAIIMYDCLKEKEVWSAQLDCKPASIDPVISGDSTVCFAASAGEGTAAIVQIDLDSGKELARTKLPAEDYPDVEQIAASEDGRWVAGWYTYLGAAEDMLFMIDTVSGEITDLGTRDSVSSMMFTEQGQLIICGEAARLSELDMAQYDLADLEGYAGRSVFTTEKERTVVIESIDAQKQEALWRSEFTESFSGFPRVDLEGSEGLFPGQVVCSFGNCMKAFDQEGRETMACDFASPIRAFWKPGKNTRKNALRGILLDGQLGVYDTKEHEMVTQNNIFLSPVYEAYIQDKQIFIQYTEAGSISTGDTLIQYAYRGRDPRWESFKDSLSAGDGDAGALSFEDAFIEYAHLNRDFRIQRRQADTGKIVWKKTYSMDDYDFGTCLGAAGDTLWFDGNETVVHGEVCRGMIRIDLNNGALKQTTYSLDDKPAANYFPENHSLMETANGFLYVSDLSSTNTEGGAFRMLAKVDPEEGTIKSRPLEFGDMNSVICAEPGGEAIFLFDGRKIRKERPDGEELFEVNAEECAPRGMGVSPDGDLIICGNADGQTIVYRYLTKNGKLISKAAVPEDVGTEKATTFSLQALPGGETLIGMDKQGYLIGGEDWGVLSKVQSFMAYNEEKQQFFLRGDEGSGHIPYCSLPEMIKRGQEEVGR